MLVRRVGFSQLLMFSRALNSSRLTAVAPAGVLDGSAARARGIVSSRPDVIFWLQFVSLAIIVFLTLVLWQPLAGSLFIHIDDLAMFEASRQIAAGHWELLLQPQGAIHVLPLFRLVRLYFDLHYPDLYSGLYWCGAIAHLGSVALLFFLSRRFLGGACGALVVAGLFAWHSLGALSLYLRAHATYVLSLPFLLGALHCLCRLYAGSTLWALGASLCLLAAVGLHSLVAACAIPGVFLGYVMLGRRAGICASSADRAAGAACLLPLLLAGALWLYSCPAALMGLGLPRLLLRSSEIPWQLWQAARGTLLHFGFLIWHNPPSQVVVLVGALALLGLLVLLRSRPSARWIITGLTLAALPVYFGLVVRGWSSFTEPRFLYLGFLPVAIAAGSAVDAGLEKLNQHRWAQVILMAGLALAAPFYYANQRRMIGDLELRYRQAGVKREVLLGWASFIEQAAARAQASSTVFRLPAFQVHWWLSSHVFFTICHPQGLPGITALTPQQTEVRDCENFWREMQEIRRQRTPFSQVPLLPSLLISPVSGASAAGGVVCTVGETAKKQ